MRERPWSFRTTEGVVTVGEDAIGFRSPPREFLAGQRARWQSGGPGDQAAAAFGIVLFVLSPALVAYYLAYPVVTGPDVLSMGYLAGGLVFAYVLWDRHGRETEIPRSRIRRVVLDETTRELTVTYATGDGPLSFLREDTRERTVTARTDEDLERAREALGRRNVPYDLASGIPSRETVYRYDTRGGVTFCGRCRAQVSPADAACPACGYALRVERPAPVGTADG